MMMNNPSSLETISRPPSVLYRYHKTPIHVSSNIKSAYDFPLGTYNLTTIKQQRQVETGYYYIEDKDNKKNKGGLFGTLKRIKNNNKKNIKIITSNRSSLSDEEISESVRRYSV